MPMPQNYNLISYTSFEDVTGPLEFNMTNDYIFKAVLQECQDALVGLISALLFIEPTSLKVKLLNPIELGKAIGSKDFYLDLRVIVNNYKIINLEMQVANLGAWNDRSLSYSSRIFDNLKKGQTYKDVTPVHHIGFTCFDVFRDNNKFYDTFRMSNSDNSQILTNKFILSVVNLKRIDEATEADKTYNLDKWCRFITASTWDEVRYLAKEDSLMLATAKALFNLSSDFDIREEAIRRDEYYAHVHELEEEILLKDAAMAEKDASIAEKDASIAEKDASIAEKDASIAEKDALIAQLKAQLAGLK